MHHGFINLHLLDKPFQNFPLRDIVVLNAAAGLVAFDLAESPSTIEDSILDRLGAKMAICADAIDSGASAAKLAEWVAATK